MNPEATWWNGDEDRDEPCVVCRECNAVVPEDEAHGARWGGGVAGGHEPQHDRRPARAA